MRRGESALLFVAAGLVAVAVMLLAWNAQQATANADREREFQRLVGGLGFGPAANLEHCEFGFDPRLCATCSYDLGPIPGGIFFCPDHAGTATDAHVP